MKKVGLFTLASAALNVAQGVAYSKLVAKNMSLRVANGQLTTEAADLRQQLANQQRQTTALRAELEALRRKSEV